ncbi:MAG: hypothetical protein COY75_08755 [Nitrospirae bacterium CG_4_10_14_0_8_um_filter_41_23]|nr:hypothetical protein [Nitrospirota bacterium]OIP58642.1 MAG: hypothetical protein AUK38_07620 [Nitrospirae bacterium CG2_30_41_42]PIQ93724.1 MAG: hypothetical protein COV68_08370 [Nitrospirae bacterium CG11_big_fil_rev_8_21_14_0_20_41_14]PIV42641.1 MAG: hypothetical protein COS27_06865 [Nitrospirae bacterium CG02_land_8_20_14_3_00_41_53]PIW87208.1 MAG: hypothetical protein COZ94_06540 [Nitrospirae bacterium CG_4_8_14_3_um_filter_41_47]PIY86312.1 MAG: hypothetical protein COY75_08755 [Nitros
MKKAIAIIVAVLFVFALTSISFAAEKKAATATAPAEKKEAPAKVKQVSGEVVTVDATAGTLTVKSKKKEVVLSTNDKTVIKIGKEKKALADIMVGDKVKAKYTEIDGKNVAKSIAAKSITIRPAEKKTVPAKPAKSAK